MLKPNVSTCHRTRQKAETEAVKLQKQGMQLVTIYRIPNGTGWLYKISWLDLGAIARTEGNN